MLFLGVYNDDDLLALYLQFTKDLGSGTGYSSMGRLVPLRPKRTKKVKNNADINRTTQNMHMFQGSYIKGDNSFSSSSGSSSTRFKRTLFIRTKYNMRISGVIPIIKLQNDT